MASAFCLNFSAICSSLKCLSKSPLRMIFMVSTASCVLCCVVVGVACRALSPLPDTHTISTDEASQAVVPTKEIFLYTSTISRAVEIHLRGILPHPRLFGCDTLAQRGSWPHTRIVKKNCGVLDCAKNARYYDGAAEKDRRGGGYGFGI